MRFSFVGALTLVLSASAANAGDLAAGKKVFNKCRTCHQVGESAKNAVGPILNGVVGRPWGLVEGYKYSGGRDGTLLAYHTSDLDLVDGLVLALQDAYHLQPEVR